MTAEQIRALGPAFAAYPRRFEPCFVDSSTVEHRHTCCRGLLSDLPRKSVEPIALAAGTAVRTLQEFLRDHVWDHRRMRDCLHGRLAQRLAELPGDDLGTVGLLDETSVVKKGARPLVSSGSGAVPSASGRTASSPSTSVSPGGASRPWWTPTSSCPSRGPTTAAAAARPASRMT